MRASYNNSDTFSQVLRWESDTSSPAFKPDNTNEQVLLDLNIPSNATSLILEFGLLNAGNDWWWAIDNVELFTPTYLEVDQTTGEMIIHGADQLSGYEITSASNSLDSDGWRSDNLDARNIGPAVPLSADLNNDHRVDLADYTVWRNNLGDDRGGDINGDEITDAQDYALWKSSIGDSLGVGESWETVEARSNHLIEFFLLGDTSFTAQSIGLAYDATIGATDLAFTYTLANGDEISGTVVYSSSATVTALSTAVPEPLSVEYVATAMALVVCRRLTKRGHSTLSR